MKKSEAINIMIEAADSWDASNEDDLEGFFGHILSALMEAGMQPPIRKDLIIQDGYSITDSMQWERE